MEHATGKEGKAEHPGEWFGILSVFVILAFGIMITGLIMSDASAGQFERLEAIEFQLSCPEHQRYVDVDGELFCAAEEVSE